MRKVRFYASPLFVERRWTWRGLRTFPHPTIVKLADGVYFGHPVTIARARQEIEMEAYARSRPVRRRKN